MLLSSKSLTEWVLKNCAFDQYDQLIRQLMSDHIHADKYSYQAIIQLPRKIEPIKDFHSGSLRGPQLIMQNSSQQNTPLLSNIT